MNQALTELTCITVCGLVAGYLKKSQPLPRALRANCLAVVRNKHALSARLKSVLKTIHGAQKQLGKLAWDHMLKMHEEASVQTTFEQKTTNVLNKYCDDMTKTLEDAKAKNNSVDVYDVADLLNDLFDNEEYQECLKYIAAFSGEKSTPTCEGGQLTQKAETVTMQALSFVLEDRANFEDFTMTLFKGSYADDVIRAKVAEGCSADDPDAIMCQALVDIIDVLVACEPADGVASSLQALKNRLVINMLTYNFWLHVVQSDGKKPRETLCALSQIWAQHLVAKELKVSDDCPPSIRAFLQKVDAWQIADEMTGTFLVHHCLPDTEDAQHVLQLVHEMKDVLPPVVDALAWATCEYQRVKTAYQKTRHGQNAGGLCYLTDLLASVENLKVKHPDWHLVREGVDVQLEGLVDDWARQFDQLMNKACEPDKLDPFIEKYSPVLNATIRWEFEERELALVKEQESNPKDDSQNEWGQIVAQFVQQYTTTVATVSRLMSTGSKLGSFPWKHGAFEKCKEVAEASKKRIELVKKSALTMAATVWASVLKSSSGREVAEAAKSFVQNELKLSDDDLPTEVVKRSKAALLGTGSGSASSSSGVSPTLATVESARPRSKRLKQR